MSHLALTFRPATSELSRLRRSLRSFLDQHDEPPDEWLLIANELVTNAIEAAPSSTEIDVEVDVRTDHIRLRVVDMGEGFAFEEASAVPPSSRRGRGLFMVQTLADTFAVTADKDRTTATATRVRAASRDSAPRSSIATSGSDASRGDATVRRVDVAIIGLGSAGEATASRLAKSGRSVVGFERDLVGGECPFVACMPSKSLLFDGHGARSLDDPTSAWPDAVDRRNDIVNDRDDSEHLQELTRLGVEVVRAEARVVGRQEVEADGQVWHADHVVLATGSAPVIPGIDGLQRSKVWTPFDALSERDLPHRVGIIGAGPVGCELADVYTSFGSAVSVFDHGDRLLPDHDAEVGQRYLEGMRALGIDIVLGTVVQRVEHHDDGDVIVHSDGTRSSEITVDRIIVAAGQAPRLANLGLETIGLDEESPPDLGPQRQPADMAWLSMIGDMNGQTPWTHGANRDAAIVADAILGSPWTETAAAMPRATFTRPTAAHVGLAATSENGFLRGRGTQGDVARGTTDELEDLLVVVAVDPSSGTVVGCSAVGPLADELIATATSLVHFGISIERARTQVFAFPTISQVLEVAIADAAEQWDRTCSTG